MERAGAPAGSQIRLEPFQELAGVPATPRSRLAQRASLRVGRKSIAGAHPLRPEPSHTVVRALAIDCRPIQPLQRPRSFRNALYSEHMRVGLMQRASLGRFWLWAAVGLISMFGTLSFAG